DLGGDVEPAGGVAGFKRYAVVERVAHAAGHGLGHAQGDLDLGGGEFRGLPANGLASLGQLVVVERGHAGLPLVGLGLQLDGAPSDAETFGHLGVTSAAGLLAVGHELAVCGGGLARLLLPGVAVRRELEGAERHGGLLAGYGAGTCCCARPGGGTWVGCPRWRRLGTNSTSSCPARRVLRRTRPGQVRSSWSVAVALEARVRESWQPPAARWWSALTDTASNRRAPPSYHQARRLVS